MPSWLLPAAVGSVAHTSGSCKGWASMAPSATTGSLAGVGPPQGWDPGPTVWGAPVLLQGVGLSGLSLPCPVATLISPFVVPGSPSMLSLYLSLFICVCVCLFISVAMSLWFCLYVYVLCSARSLFHTPASGPLHWLLPLLGILSCQISNVLLP